MRSVTPLNGNKEGLRIRQAVMEDAGGAGEQTVVSL